MQEMIASNLKQLEERNSELEEAFQQKQMEAEGQAFQIEQLQQRLEKCAMAERQMQAA